MAIGQLGVFVISWAQTKLDDRLAANPTAVQKGAVWSWSGDALRVDGAIGLLRAQPGEGEALMRRKAAQLVRRLVSEALNDGTGVESQNIDEPIFDDSFVVTDGMECFSVTLIEVLGKLPLLMFVDCIPPKDRKLWVVHHEMNHSPYNSFGDQTGQMICFAPGTLMSTPRGQRAIETLHEGDLLHTGDNGLQEIQWIGSRRMTGARLYAYPKLRPIRVKAGALGAGQPLTDIVVSPDHKFLLRGKLAQELFNSPEVLVTARELINGNSIATDFALREVTYIHLMLPRHEIIFANGAETESFHPADTSLSALNAKDRLRLEAIKPGITKAPFKFGRHVRRSLSASEVAMARQRVA